MSISSSGETSICQESYWDPYIIKNTFKKDQY